MCLGFPFETARVGSCLGFSPLLVQWTDSKMDSAKRPLTVHVIDDDPAMRDALSVLMESVLMPVRTYDSATNFLDQDVAGLEGCIVTDVEMPALSGIDLLKRLSGVNAGLPAIVMSGRAGDAVRAEALRNGAVVFLEKPFEDDVVLDAVRAAFRSAGYADPLA